MAASPRKLRAPDAETLASIVEQLQHMSARALAKKLGVSAMTIVRWRDQYAASNAPPVTRPAVEAPAAAPDEDPLANVDSLATMKRLLANTLRRIREAEEIGATEQATKLIATAEKQLNTIARVEARVGANMDTVSVARADVETKMDEVRERVRAILDRPLLCASCSRALSVAWGKGEEK